MKAKELEGGEDSKANMQRAWSKKYVPTVIYTVY